MAKAVGQTIKAVMQSGANYRMPFWMAEGYCPEDAQVAAQAATTMSERFGIDMAIMPNLEVIPLKQAEEAPLEIVRCPAALRRYGKKVWQR